MKSVVRKVKGEIFRGLFAIVELKTEKRLKYAHEIKTIFVNLNNINVL